MRHVLLSLSLCLAVSCAKPERERLPTSDSTLVELITDLHVQEARWSLGDSSITRESVLRNHGFTYKEYQDVLSSMVEDPDRLVSIYDSVIHLLTNRPQQQQKNDPLE